MKRSKVIALSAVCSAFAILCLTLGAVIEIFDYSAIFMASMCSMIPLAKGSKLGGFMTYLATLLLSCIFFVGVRPDLVLTYGIFFGLHPTVNYLFKEKKINKILSLVLKIVWFVLSIILIYTLFSGFLFEESLLTNPTFQKYAYLILAVGGAILFVVYDLVMMHFQKALDKMIEKLKL